MSFSLTPNANLKMCLNPKFQDKCLLFFIYINLQIKINRMVKEHTADYHPSPSVVLQTSRTHHLIFLWNS